MVISPEVIRESLGGNETETLAALGHERFNALFFFSLGNGLYGCDARGRQRDLGQLEKGLLLRRDF